MLFFFCLCFGGWFGGFVGLVGLFVCFGSFVCVCVYRGFFCLFVLFVVFFFLAETSNTEMKASMFLICSKQMEFLSSSVVVLKLTILLLQVLSLS